MVDFACILDYLNDIRNALDPFEYYDDAEIVGRLKKCGAISSLLLLWCDHPVMWSHARQKKKSYQKRYNY